MRAREPNLLDPTALVAFFLVAFFLVEEERMEGLPLVVDRQGVKRRFDGIVQFMGVVRQQLELAAPLARFVEG